MSVPDLEEMNRELECISRSIEDVSRLILEAKSKDNSNALTNELMSQQNTLYSQQVGLSSKIIELLMQRGTGSATGNCYMYT